MVDFDRLLKRRRAMLLRCVDKNKLATKVHRMLDTGWQTDDFTAGMWFDAFQSMPLDDVQDVYEMLLRLEDQPDWFVIRGGLIDPDVDEDAEDKATGIRFRREYRREVRRTMKDQYDRTGEFEYPAEFESVDRMWICVDLDEAEGATGKAPNDYEKAVKWAIKTHLPECFHDVDVAYQWSSSAGVKPWTQLRLHLWYWLDRPAFDPSLYAWFSRLHGEGAPIDARLFNPIQIHYTAAPIFEGRAEDPIPERTGLILTGNPAATLPDNVLDREAWRAKKKAEDEERERRLERKRREAEKRAPAKAEDMRIRYAQVALDDADETIRSAGRGGRHDTIFKEAAAIGELVAAGFLDEQRARDVLEAAAQSLFTEKTRQRDVPRVIRDAMDQGKANPRDLSHVGAVRRTRRRDDGPPTTEGGGIKEAFNRRREAAEDDGAPFVENVVDAEDLPKRHVEESERVREIEPREEATDYVRTRCPVCSAKSYVFESVGGRYVVPVLPFETVCHECGETYRTKDGIVSGACRIAKGAI